MVQSSFLLIPLHFNNICEGCALLKSPAEKYCRKVLQKGPAENVYLSIYCGSGDCPSGKHPPSNSPENLHHSFQKTVHVYNLTIILLNLPVKSMEDIKLPVVCDLAG